jgi:hypothetical protein
MDLSLGAFVPLCARPGNANRVVLSRTKPWTRPTVTLSGSVACPQRQVQGA